MSKEEIFKMLDNGMTCDDLVRKFKKPELSKMYTEVFNGELTPPSSYKKVDIAYKIFEYYSDSLRTKDLSKIL